MRKTHLLETVKNDTCFLIHQPQKVVFADNNAYFDKHKVTSLAQMQNSSFARNNCWPASQAVIKHLGLDSRTDYDRVMVSGMETPAGNHYAILIIKGDDGVIVDYTARQFDAKAPFPMIIDAWDWQLWTEAKIGREGHWMHDQSMVGY